MLVLATLSLAACGNNSAQKKENASLKAENSSLKAKKKSKSSSSSSTNSQNDQQNNQTAASSSSTQTMPTTQDVVAKLRTAKGFNGPDYDITCDDEGGGIFRLQVRQDGGDTASNGHTAFVGNFQYDANTGAFTEI